MLKAKVALPLLIVMPLFFGCAGQDDSPDVSEYTEEPTTDFSSVDFSQREQPLEGMEWVKIMGGKNIAPQVVYNDTLYGVPSTEGEVESETDNVFLEIRAYKLEGSKWVKAPGSFIRPTVVYNQELYGESPFGVMKLQGNEWVEAAGAGGEFSSVIPSIVYNNSLYGYTPWGKLYKLDGSHWFKLNDQRVVPAVVYNGNLYGYELINEETYRLTGDRWLELEGKNIRPEVVYKGELYGSDWKGYYKLRGERWVLVSKDPFKPKLVYNGELYGEIGYYTYVLKGTELALVSDQEVQPRLVYRGELYGYKWGDGTYKLINKRP